MASITNKRKKFLRTWVRTDIAHLIKAATGWDYFTPSVDNRIKQFYVIIIGYKSTMRTFDEFLGVFKKTLNIALTPFETLNAMEGTADLIARV